MKRRLRAGWLGVVAVLFFANVPYVLVPTIAQAQIPVALWLGNDGGAGPGESGATVYHTSSNGTVIPPTFLKQVTGIATDTSTNSLYLSNGSTVERRDLSGSLINAAVPVTACSGGAGPGSPEDMAWGSGRLWRINHRGGNTSNTTTIQSFTVVATSSSLTITPLDCMRLQVTNVGDVLDGTGLAFDNTRGVLVASLCVAPGQWCTTTGPGVVVEVPIPPVGSTTATGTLLFRTDYQPGGLCYAARDTETPDTLWLGGRGVVRNLTRAGAVVSSFPRPPSANSVFMDGLDCAAQASGTLKICKVAGPGVDVNTNYTFGGFGATVTIPAGPAATGGYCRVVGSFAVGTNVLIDEVLPSDNQVSIDVKPPGQLVGSPDLVAGSVVVSVGPGVTEVTFTNRRTGIIEICKESGTPAVGGSFQFSVDGRSFTVPVNSCTGPIEVPAGPNVVTETFQPGTQLVSCSAIPVSALVPNSCNPQTGSATVNVTPGGIANQAIITFTNRRSAVPAPVVGVFRPTSGVWYFNDGVGGTSSVAWGMSGDVAVAADYDGDVVDDVAVFRPSSGTWYVRGSATEPRTIRWGASGDVPVPADYDGDGSEDVAVFGPSSGAWYVNGSAGTNSAVMWGVSGDVPVPADYDGDGKADIAVFRQSSGTWFIRGGTGASSASTWGVSGDIPVPADYDGDGRADLAVFRPSSGIWYIRGSAGTSRAVEWGALGDVPAPADYDADGRADVAVFRPSNGLWYINQGAAGGATVHWGMSGDIPVTTPPAVWRYYFTP